LISTSLDGTLRIWDYEEASCLRVFQSSRTIRELLGVQDGTVWVVLKGRVKLSLPGIVG
jgi:WD40 repeat protein